jgi:hypothetical protein
MNYQISQEEFIKILSVATQIGFQKGLESSFSVPKYVSQNQAAKLLTRTRLENLVKQGKITPKINGNGKTSTKLYNLSELMVMDSSDKIIIQKGYESPNKLKLLTQKNKTQ